LNAASTKPFARQLLAGVCSPVCDTIRAMALAPGSRLGDYVVVEPLDAGGPPPLAVFNPASAGEVSPKPTRGQDAAR
jgi:hypothetical protein